MAQNSLSATLNSSNYTVGTFGTLDWALFGSNNNFSSDSFTPAITKSGGGSLISGAAGVGSNPFNYPDLRTVTWTGGTPTGSGSHDFGVYADPPGGGGAGSQLTITTPADTTAKILRLYLSTYQTTVCTITATLSDGSAGPSVDTTTFSGLTAPDAGATGYVDITFQAASGGQTLTVTVVCTTASNGYGNVAIQAAALKLASSPDVTVNLTGQAATTARGTLAPARSVPVTGQSITASRGTITTPGNVTVALTGQAATTARGTLVPSRSVPVTGQAATIVQSYAGYVSSPGYPITLLTSINTTSAYALQASPALSAGDSVRISAGGSAGASPAPLTITINADATWTQSTTPVAFDFQVFDPATQTWGAWATQSIGVTVAVTGQASTSAAGTIAPARALPPTGQAATSAAGTIAPARSVPVTGQAATAAAGTLAPARALAVAGQAATASPGTLAPAITIALTGLSATASPGSVVAAIAKALTGQGLAIAQGTITTGGDVTVSLTGLGAASATGTMLPSAAATLVGQSVAAALGTLTPAHAAALTGQAATAAQGTLALAAALQLVGAALAAAQGTVTVNAGGNVTVALTGQGMAAALGTLSPVHAQALTGAGAAGAAGALIAAHAAGVTGQAATAAPGTVATLRALALLGIPATVSQGTITPQQGANVTVNLTGLSAAMAVGGLESGIAITLGGVSMAAEDGTIWAFVPPTGGSPDAVLSLEGTLASPNPFSDMLSGEGAIMSGENGCILGRFAWASIDGTASSARLSPEDQLGFALMRQATWGALYWSSGRPVLRAGQPMVLLTTGDVWARFENGAYPGAQVYARKMDGSCVSGYAADAEQTPWYVVTPAQPGGLAIISTTSRVT